MFHQTEYFLLYKPVVFLNLVASLLTCNHVGVVFEYPNPKEMAVHFSIATWAKLEEKGRNHGPRHPQEKGSACPTDKTVSPVFSKTPS